MVFAKATLEFNGWVCLSSKNLKFYSGYSSSSTLYRSFLEFIYSIKDIFTRNHEYDKYLNQSLFKLRVNYLENISIPSLNKKFKK